MNDSLLKNIYRSDFSLNSRALVSLQMGPLLEFQKNQIDIGSDVDLIEEFKL